MTSTDQVVSIRRLLSYAEEDLAYHGSRTVECEHDDCSSNFHMESATYFLRKVSDLKKQLADLEPQVVRLPNPKEDPTAYGYDSTDDYMGIREDF